MADQVESGSRIIAVLEAAWADIRAAHPDVPHVVMITGTARTRRAREAKLGHFGADRWVQTEGKVALPELFVAGELLMAADGVSGGRRALKTLLHEAAHGMAHVRGIQDCSRQNRYHNKRFAAHAAELGLSAPDQPHGTLGYSACVLGEETAGRWAATIEAIDGAALPFLVDFLGGGGQAGGDGHDGDKSKKGRSGKRLAAVCGCVPARRLSITPKQLEVGGIMCAVCMGEFELEEVDGEDQDDADD